MRNMENIASSVGSIAQYRFSLSRKVMPWTTLWVNNYGYESKRRRKKIYFWVYGSISFFTIFVECQEHGLQQHNGKKKNNTNICFANIDIYRYFRLLIKISRLKNLILCILTSEKNWSGWKILKKKKWYWSRRRGRANVVVFWRNEVSHMSGGAVYVAKYYSDRGRRRTGIWGGGQCWRYFSN